ncbi:ttuB [Scenedesmus sp. PABB004]|nr:ttuB [Scenedesmus sp. PABB004]
MAGYNPLRASAAPGGGAPQPAPAPLGAVQLPPPLQGAPAAHAALPPHLQHAGGGPPALPLWQQEQTKQQAQQQTQTQQQGAQVQQQPQQPPALPGVMGLLAAARGGGGASGPAPTQQAPPGALAGAPPPQSANMAPMGFVAPQAAPPTPPAPAPAPQPAQQPAQQPAPPPAPPPAPALPFAPRRRPTLDGARAALAAAAGGTPAFDLAAAMRWVARFAPEAARLVDKTIKSYFDYIRDKHGTCVLACCAFFVCGQSRNWRGATRGLTLTGADSPVKVLNQRLSFYRLFFSRSPPKCERMAALVALRPDVVWCLTDDTAVDIFDTQTPTDVAYDALAALAMLPAGWGDVCGSEPHAWLTNYVRAVLRDVANADKMCLFLERRLAQHEAAGGAGAGGAPGPAAGAAALTADTAPSWRAQGPERVSIAEAVAQQAQQVQQVQLPRAPPAPAPGTWARAVAAQPPPTIVQAAQHSRWGVPGSTGPAAAAAMHKPGAPGGSRVAAMHGAAAAAAAAAAAGAAPAGAPPARAASPGGSSGSSPVELALVQLFHERPDVSAYATRELREAIKALPAAQGLAAVGELVCLDKGWEAALPPRTAPRDHLAQVVKRAAAHVAMAGAAGDDDDGWTKLGSSPARGGAGAAAAGLGAAGAGPGAQLQAAWAALERERPDLTAHMQDFHRAPIMRLPVDQQLQVLERLRGAPENLLDPANTRDPTGRLLAEINARVRLLHPLPPRLETALAAFARHHPHVAPYIDDGMVVRLVNLPLDVALSGIRALDATFFSDSWPSDVVKSPSGWLMGIIKREERRLAERAQQHGGGGAGAPAPPAVGKVHRHVLPLLVALVVVNYLDRTALAFAALQLCDTAWFDARVMGVGAALFYASYVTFQIPANLALTRLGPRFWLPAIAAAWGAAAAGGAAVASPAGFYAQRLALGAAEAGCFPAVWAVCGCFYPQAHITLPYSIIEASIAASQILAAPAAAALLQLGGAGGLAGWQWLFLVEGAATVALAGVLRWRLPGCVESAPFLDDADRAWLRAQLGAQHAAHAHAPTPAPAHAGQGKPPCGSGDAVLLLDGVGPAGGSAAPPGGGTAAAPLGAWAQVRLTFSNRLTLYLMALKALKDVSLDGLVYFVPLLVHALLDGGAALSLGAAPQQPPGGGGGGGKRCGGRDSQLRAVLVSAIPFGAAAAAAVALGASSQRRDERRLHIGLPLLAGGGAFLLLPLLLRWAGVAPAFAAVTAGVVAADATTGPFWSWVHDAASPGTGPVSLAAVNSVGKAGGALGPLFFGLWLHASGSFVASIIGVGAVMLAAGGLALAYPGDRRGRAGGGSYAAVAQHEGGGGCGGGGRRSTELAALQQA